MDSYIEVLENEIETQTSLLKTYISHQTWQKAGLQQEYINGLAQALHLAMATYVANQKEVAESKGGEHETRTE